MKNELSVIVNSLIKLADSLDAKNKFALANETDQLIKQIMKKADQDGSYMSVQNLKSIHDHSAEILKMIDEETVLPDWLESKINRASSDILSVSEYLKFGSREEHEEYEDEKEDDEYEMESDILDNYADDADMEIAINQEMELIDSKIDNLKSKKDMAEEKEEEEIQKRILQELCATYLEKIKKLEDYIVAAENSRKHNLAEKLKKILLENEKALKSCQSDLRDLE